MLVRFGLGFVGWRRIVGKTVCQVAGEVLDLPAGKRPALSLMEGGHQGSGFSVSDPKRPVGLVALDSFLRGRQIGNHGRSVRGFVANAASGDKKVFALFAEGRVVVARLAVAFEDCLAIFGGNLNVFQPIAIAHRFDSNFPRIRNVNFKREVFLPGGTKYGNRLCERSVLSLQVDCQMDLVALPWF